MQNDTEMAEKQFPKQFITQSGDGDAKPYFYNANASAGFLQRLKKTLPKHGPGGAKWFPKNTPGAEARSCFRTQIAPPPRKMIFEFHLPKKWGTNVSLSAEWKFLKWFC